MTQSFSASNPSIVSDNGSAQQASAVVDGLIDMHTHAICPELDVPEWWRGSGLLPSVHRLDERTARICVGGVPYRVVDDRCWSAQRRLRDMDAEGVGVQVLSPVPVTLCHDAPAEQAVWLARAQNDFLATMVRSRPDRFRALGAVPMQDPAAAIAELRRCMELGFVGVEIGTRVGDRELSDDCFDEFFAVAATTDALVLVHPVDTTLDRRPRDLGIGFGVGMPCETGIAAAGWLASGALARRPRVRLCLAHGGGSLPWLLPRLDVGALSTNPDYPRELLPSVQARWLYSDSLTYDADCLLLVARRFGADHIMLGTDYPFAARERPAGAVLAGTPYAAIDLALRRAIGKDNAQMFFDINHSPSR